MQTASFAPVLVDHVGTAAVAGGGIELVLALVVSNVVVVAVPVAAVDAQAGVEVHHRQMTVAGESENAVLFLLYVVK